LKLGHQQLDGALQTSTSRKQGLMRMRLHSKGKDAPVLLHRF
jgi:hypothetical protein